MRNAQYDRARAQERLKLIAPTLGDDLEDQANEILREADRRAAHVSISDVVDAVARKYFAHRIRNAHKDTEDSIPSPLARPSCLHCGTVMSLILIEPDQEGFDLRTFQCPTCNGAEKIIIQYKPDHG